MPPPASTRGLERTAEHPSPDLQPPVRDPEFLPHTLVRPVRDREFLPLTPVHRVRGPEFLPRDLVRRVHAPEFLRLDLARRVREVAEMAPLGDPHALVKAQCYTQD